MKQNEGKNKKQFFVCLLFLKKKLTELERKSGKQKAEREQEVSFA